MGLRVFFLAFFWVSIEAWAFTPFLAENGRWVRWPGGGRYRLAGNSANSSGIIPSQLFDVVVRGLRRWERASGGRFQFDYWQGTESRTYLRALEYDGLSSLHFESHSQRGSGLGPSVIGLTQVWYRPDSGEILEADIVLNDVNFEFTLDPSDTTGPSVLGNRGTFQRPRVYIENVVTHEIGHAIGISHSGVMQATMLPVEAPGQAQLDCDDQASARVAYGQTGASIGGRIIGAGGSPVFGAHVSVISVERGAVVNGAISGPAGGFEVRGLEAGSYLLVVEPYPADASALSVFFQGMNTAVCTGRRFSKTFLTEAGTPELTILQVSENQRVSVGDFAVTCQGEQAALARGHSEILIRSGTGAAIFQPSFSGSDIAVALDHGGGGLELSVIAFGFSSPLDTRIALFRTDGRRVEGDGVDDRFSTPSGYRNFDSRFRVVSLEAGRYQVRIESRWVSTSLMPGGKLAIESSPYVVLAARQGSRAGGDARCLMDESSFASYQSPPGGPPRLDVSGRSSVGFCGRIEQIETEFERRMGPPGSNLGAITGWFLPWFFMLSWGHTLRAWARRRTVKA